MIIDCREKDLIEEITQIINTISSFKEIVFETKSLDVGDILVHDVIIERKTLSDMAASIHDGRYKEQGFRLTNSETNNHNIFYLIEGDFRSSRDKRVDKTMIYSSMVSLQYFKGFSLIRTENLKETAFFLCNMWLKIKKEGTPGHYSLSSQPMKEGIHLEKQYAGVIKTQKKANITKNNINEIMLMQIPGVSSTIATHILQKYNTIYELTSEIGKIGKLSQPNLRNLPICVKKRENQRN